jgi:acetyl-CoA carboxylase biotin carboxyl carrier protein
MTPKIEVQVSELRQITSWLTEVDIEFVEISRPGTTIRLTAEAQHRAIVREPSLPSTPDGRTAAAVFVPEGVQKQVATVTANSVGIFLDAHPARSTPFVGVESRVAKGDIIGLLQIAQLCVPVIAPIGGRVLRILAAHGDKVGYGTPLFVLAAAAE